MESLRVIPALLLLFSLSINIVAGTRNLTPLSRRTVSNAALKINVDTLIVGGTIVTMNEKREVIADGAIAINHGNIEMMGTRGIVSRNVIAKQTIDATGKFIIPGLINTHTHVPMVLFRGIADDLDLNEWLTKYIFPAEAKNVSEQFVRAGTRLGLAEMIRGGTTTYCDMYYFEDAIADESKKAGVRGVLGETVIDFPVADNKTPEEALNYTERFIKKWKDDPLIVPAIAPHAPYTVSAEHLKAVVNVSNKYQAPIVIHIAETKKERDDISSKTGMTPVKYLDSLGILTDRTIAAHSIWLTPEEINIYRDRNVGVAHCPQSNMKLASGVAPVNAMLSENIAVGLGTDGAASNNDLNIWEEMDTAAKLHKVISGDPKMLPAQTVFEMATIRGARALHLDDKIGSIEIGKRADIVLVDTDSLNQTPFYDVYSSLVYSTKAADVDTVIIDGRIVMRNRRLLTLNENVIKKDANAYLDKIIKSLGK